MEEKIKSPDKTESMEETKNPKEKYKTQFLKTQIYNMSKRIGKVLSQSNSKKNNWKKWKENNLPVGNDGADGTFEWKLDDSQSQLNDGNKVEENKKKKPRTEREAIKNILESKWDILRRKAIVVDITYLKKEWSEKRVTQFECKYWLWITITNLNSFITFCKLHGFIPFFNKISIKSNDVSKEKSLSTFFALAISEISEDDTTTITLNEIQKYPKEIQPALKDLVSCLREIIHYDMITYPRTYWKRLKKSNNIWSLSENIFVEIALRLENQIREKVWIESSYLDLARHEEDAKEKTDMKFLIKKTPKQKYQKIPIQFTNSRITWQQGKEEDVERHLMENARSNNKDKIQSFLILTVNGEFSKHMTHRNRPDEERKQGNKEFVIINEEYQDWINAPQEREKYTGDKFPLFIDSIDHKLIQPAEIIYIALHMLYKKHNFRYTTEETYIDSFKGHTQIEKRNHEDINGIKLSDICINECSIEEIDDPRLGYPVLLKHRFEIFYQWKRMGVIVIYEAEQSRKKEKNNKKEEDVRKK